MWYICILYELYENTDFDSYKDTDKVRLFDQNNFSQAFRIIIIYHYLKTTIQNDSYMEQLMDHQNCSYMVQ